jgi:hypothetical protein
MSRQSADTLDACLDQFASRLPAWAGSLVRWITAPSAGLIRIPLGTVLIAGGIIGFLPILGFWMVPLGLAVIARDIPFLRPPLIALLSWINRKSPQRRKSH